MNLITHDRLLQDCFWWAWNKYPVTRGLLFHVHNEAKPQPGESKRNFTFRLKYMKSIGVIPGVFDFLFWWKARLYPLDAKLPGDRLSGAQIEWMNIAGHHGAECYTFDSLEAFKTIFEKIMKEG